MTALQAIVLAIIQGVTELFPVSSLGHAVVIPDLLHWNIRQDDPGFLPFLVVMHLGTAIALLLYFWRDWWDFARAVLLNQGENPAGERGLFWRVVVATIPAVIIGALFEKPLRTIFFAHGSYAAAFLIVNGVILFVAERMKRPDDRETAPPVAGAPAAGQRSLYDLRWKDAVAIGVWQCLALIPGLSRSGTTMVGGFLAGLNHKDAARFSFLTGTPIILAATVHEGPKLLHMHSSFSSLAVVAGVVAGVAAYISVWALMRWFNKHEFKAFDPFAYYCVIAGVLSLGYLVFMR
jgi:undecaprenyl-diphosphatase